MQRRLVIEPFDPRRVKAGGIDTCIRGLVKYHPDDMELHIVGVDTMGDLTLGRTYERELDGRPFAFTPVAQLDNTQIRPKVPHVAKLAAGLARFRPGRDSDVVQSHRMTVGVFMTQLFRAKPQVQFIHNDGDANLGTVSESYFSKMKPVYRGLERQVVRKAVDVVVFNQAGAERLGRIGGSVRFSPTWFDPEYFFPPTTPRAPGPLRLLWVGRVDPAKDPLLAMRTVAALDESVRVTVAGDGLLMAETKALAAELGITSRVDFRGLVPKSAIGDLMREHDVLLMTSHYEGYPRSVVESLACGLSVVSTFGGEPNGLVVNGGNGFRVEDRDPAQLAAAITAAAELKQEDSLSSVAELSALVRVPDVLSGASSR